MHVAVRISYSVIEKAVCCMSCNHLLALKMAGVACRDCSVCKRYRDENS